MGVKNLIGSFAITALVLSGAITQAHAIGDANTNTNYTGIEGTETQFEKYFVMDEGIQVPNATFSFTVKAGVAKTGDKTHAKIMAGVGTPTIEDITFNANDTENVATTGEIGATGEVPAGKQFVKKTGKIDFSGCNFTEPGIYRYIISETGTNTGVTNDTDKIMDVFVTDNDGTLAVSGYVLHSNATDIELNPQVEGDGQYTLADKVTGFVNTFESADLTFGKKITGNQGNKYKEFTFTLKITNATPNSKYTIEYNGNRSEAQDEPETGTKTVLVTDEQGSATRTFKMTNNTFVTVKGLAKGVKYELTEDAEDYVSTNGITGETEEESYTGAQAGTMNNLDVKTGFTNSKTGVIPTGILLTTMPYFVVVLVGGAMIMLSANKKKEEN